jgi:hypothetical protein
MARILLHWRILSATLFSLVLVAGSAFVAYDAKSPRSAQASAESDLLKAIASKDTDADGLPDWEESLYGADPNRIDSFNLGMPDGQAVAQGLVVPKAVANYEINTAPNTTKNSDIDPSLPPPPQEGTLTAAFAQNLYATYRTVREAKGADLSSAELSAVTQEALKVFSASIQPSPDFKTLKDMVISGSGAEALRAYAMDIEAILKKNTATASKTELEYLQEVVGTGNEEGYVALASLAKGYRESAMGISQLPLPSDLAKEMLGFINALARLGEITTDFAEVRTDPLSTMLALEQYSGTMLALARSLVELSAVYREGGVVFSNTEAGGAFVNMIVNLEKKQAVEKL